MGDFLKFKEAIQKHFDKMQRDVNDIFEVNIDKDKLWETYLDSFPAGTNEIYRERREHDCSCCKSFIRNIGNAVFIKDNKLHTIWEMNVGDSTYQVVADALDKFVRKHNVSDRYVSKMKNIGTDHNFEEIDGKSHRWDHFFIALPDKFVDRSRRSEGDIKGEFRDIRNVFKRSLDEISLDSVDTILELISTNTLYKGAEWKSVLTEFRKHKIEYEKLSSEEKELYAWENTSKVGAIIGKIRNHSIGTLLVNVSEGMGLDEAVRKYEQIVAPSNYKRPKAIYTKKMLDDAKQKIAEMGYLDSLQRRFATLDDITVNNVLFSNKDVAKRIVGNSIFDEMEKGIAVSPKKFSKVEDISAQDFISNVLPTAREIEAYVENKHTKNFVSMTAPVIAGSKSMFKWNNPLAWAYTGNITDSEVKQNVKNAGGNVEGVMRFSIQWNESGRDNADLDAHCLDKSGSHIYFGRPMSKTGGMLDVDIVQPRGNVAVENIFWKDKSRLTPGIYKFYVNMFSGSLKDGFRAEIECDGEIHSFNYNSYVNHCETIPVADVVYKEDGTFEVIELLNNGTGAKTFSKNMWGIDTNQFVPVSVISYSPNYFDDQNGIGHRHLFFFLNGCVNPEEPNGYYNEFLNNDLLEHKRVFEALGSKCHVESADDQLSGIGFSMTKRDDLVVKVKGATERIMRIKF